MKANIFDNGGRLAVFADGVMYQTAASRRVAADAVAPVHPLFPDIGSGRVDLAHARQGQRRGRPPEGEVTTAVSTAALLLAQSAARYVNIGGSAVFLFLRVGQRHFW